MAEIKAPLALLEQCIAEQGYNPKEQNYAVNDRLKLWLIDNALEGDGSYIVPLQDPAGDAFTGCGPHSAPPAGLFRRNLRSSKS